MKLFLRKDMMVIAAALLIAALLFVLPHIRGAGTRSVTVYLDGEVYCTRPLDEPGIIEIAQQDGSVNRVRIEGSTVCMESSTCRNQLCVNMGALDANSPDGRWIVCLPNRVTVGLGE